MGVHILLVCRDGYFGELFSNYIAQCRGELAVAYFTDEDKALTYLEKNGGQIRAVLSEKEFLNGLGETSVLRVCLAGFTEVGGHEALQYLNIFQRRRELLSDLKRILGQFLDLEDSRLSHEGAQMFVFASTQGGGGKSTAAYLTAIAASRKGKTAYLTLESAPYTGRLYTRPETALSGGELLYIIRDRQSVKKAVQSALTRNLHGVYVLPQAQSLMDWLEVSGEDVGCLLDAVACHGGMDYIVVDMDSGFSPINREAIARSTCVVVVYSDDAVGRGREERLLKDPDFDALGFANRCLVVRNRCHRKTETTAETILFPFSQSLERGGDFAMVLDANMEFSGGCNRLLEKGRRGDKRWSP